MSAYDVDCAVAVPAGEPWEADHFPGRPVVPGVVLLAAVTRAVRAALAGSAQVLEWRSVRFRGAVSAPVTLRVRGAWRGEWLHADVVRDDDGSAVLSARLRCAAAG